VNQKRQMGQEKNSAITSYRLPPNNPFLIQNSVYPSVHFDSGQTDTTTLPVWPGESTLEPSQIQWLPGLRTPRSIGDRKMINK
jgi:hypothetical protein